MYANLESIKRRLLLIQVSNIEAVLIKRQPGDSPRTTKQTNNTSVSGSLKAGNDDDDDDDDDDAISVLQNKAPSSVSANYL